MFYNDELLSDFYEFTMSNGYFLNGMKDKIAYFDVFFRSIPDDGGFAIAAGLEQVVEYVMNLKFTEEDIEFLKSKKCFDEKFLDYLRTFKFTGDIYAVPEGTPIFPNEPILTVKAPIIEAQIIETFVLLVINHQSLIATKANRIVRAAGDRIVSEFGARRAHGSGAAVYGARAAYIGGVQSTSNTLTDKMFGVPSAGTMAHSWVQMFDSEYDAFASYCKCYPDNALLLIDTYNVLKSGLPNAIKAFNEVVLPTGNRPKGIRLDSGDICYLSRKCRKELDKAGFKDCKIVVSNSLDEYLIKDLLSEGSQVDIFGVGERLITSKTSPVFGGVYKLVATESADGEITPKIKISENVAKITNPHYKKVYRIYGKDIKKAEADYLCIHDEVIDDTKPLEIFDPDFIWKRKVFTNYEIRPLHVQIIKNGKLVYKLPDIDSIKNYCKEQIDSLWDEVKRFENPHKYYVDLSEKLWQLKNDLLKLSKK